MINCRVLKSKKCEITQEFIPGKHYGIDLVGAGYTLDKIVAHSKGTVIKVADGFDNMKGSRSYGNYVILNHGSGICTLYAHMVKNSIRVKVGDTVKKGQILGDMGNSGNSYGAHLHFEIRKNGNKINPIDYLNSDLPIENIKKSVEEIVDEVIDLKWGVYPERKNLLEEAGYNFREIQDLVNAKLGYHVATSNDLLVLVKNTIRGDYGNGEYRKQILGGRYEEVRRQVNLNYKYNTVNNPRLY